MVVVKTGRCVVQPLVEWLASNCAICGGPLVEWFGVELEVVLEVVYLAASVWIEW